MREMMGMKMAARNTFLIDPEGKVVEECTGVKPADHSKEVLQALSELEKKQRLIFVFVDQLT
jgi:peroxiredoxin Q/BCP